MAVGDVTDRGICRDIAILLNRTTTNGTPSGAAGIEVNSIRNSKGQVPEKVSLVVRSTAGTGTKTCTLRVWGYQPFIGDWLPLGTGGDGVVVSSKGVVNENAAIGETQAQRIRHAEVLEWPGHFTRVYIEVQAIGGTGTAISVGLSWQN